MKRSTKQYGLKTYTGRSISLPTTTQRGLANKPSFHDSFSESLIQGNYKDPYFRAREDVNILRHFQSLSTVYNGGKNVIYKLENQDSTPYTMMTTKSGTFGSKAYYEIHVPRYSAWDDARRIEAKKSGLPFNEDLSYRLYRGTSWHENQHVAYTPVKSFESNDPALKQGVGPALMNIIDDLRIEEKGVEVLPGFVPERLVRQAYWFNMRPDLSQMAKSYTDLDALKKDPKNIALMSQLANSSDPAAIEAQFNKSLDPLKRMKRKEAMLEAFAQIILFNKEKGNLDPQNQRLLEKVTEEAKKEIRRIEQIEDEDDVYSALANLTKKVMKDLDLEMTKEDDPRLQPNTPDPHTKMGSGAGAGGTIDPKALIAILKTVKTTKKHREDGDPGTILTDDDVDEAINGERITVDLSNAKFPPPRGPGGSDPDSPPAFIEPLEFSDPKLFEDPVFIDRMNQALHDWRLKRKRIFGQSGAVIDIDRIVSTNKDPFVSRVRLAKGNRKLLFVLDFSGSMAHQQKEYKTVLISTLDVLDKIHVPFAVYGFGDRSVNFFKVKDFNQKWNRQRAESLAGLEASGGTPLGTALTILAPYITKNRPRYTIVTTDGMPDNDDRARQAIRSLRKKTSMVSFAIGGQDLASNLKGLEFNHSFAAESVNAIPKQLIPMVAPTK